MVAECSVINKVKTKIRNKNVGISNDKQSLKYLSL
jgi:hypothetical protein